MSTVGPLGQHRRCMCLAGLCRCGAQCSKVVTFGAMERSVEAHLEFCATPWFRPLLPRLDRVRGPLGSCVDTLLEVRINRFFKFRCGKLSDSTDPRRSVAPKFCRSQRRTQAVGRKTTTRSIGCGGFRITLVSAKMWRARWLIRRLSLEHF